MYQHCYNNNQTKKTQRHQKGAVFIVMLVVMVMGATAFLVSSLNRSALKLAQNQGSIQTLAHAKEEVLGNILSGVGTQYPGNLLKPDMLSNSESPALNYDGTVNNGCLDANQTGSTPTPGLPLISTGSNMRCLGRLPWKTLGISINSPSENDPSGVVPWYAISANLVDSINVIFNSKLLNTNPSHPWLTVRDMKGNVLSNRVAIVLILPSAPLPGQSRSISPLGGPNQYLDSITVPSDCTAPCNQGIYKNYDLDDDFIMGDERRWIPDPSNNANQIEDGSYQFNDKLTYITIDELMPLIEKRVGNEIKKALNTYYTAWGRYPYASIFSNPSSNATTYVGQFNRYDGLLPVGLLLPSTFTSLSWVSSPPPQYSISGVPGSVDCTISSNTRLRCGSTSSPITITSGKTITVSGKLNNVGFGFWKLFDKTKMTNGVPDEVRFRKTGSTTNLPYNNSALKLTNVNVMGELFSDGSAKVTLTATATANTTLDRIELRDIQRYTIPTIPAWLFSSISDGTKNCSPSADDCQNWHQFVYYSVSQAYAPGGNLTCSGNCITVNGQGGGNNKPAIVIMTSGALGNKTQPSGNITDYLEGENLTPADLIFENKTRDSTFNDQVIVVEP